MVRLCCSRAARSNYSKCSRSLQERSYPTAARRTTHWHSASKTFWTFYFSSASSYFLSFSDFYDFRLFLFLFQFTNSIILTANTEFCYVSLCPSCSRSYSIIINIFSTLFCRLRQHLSQSQSSDNIRKGGDNHMVSNQYYCEWKFDASDDIHENWFLASPHEILAFSLLLAHCARFKVLVTRVSIQYGYSFCFYYYLGSKSNIHQHNHSKLFFYFSFTFIFSLENQTEKNGFWRMLNSARKETISTLLCCNARDLGIEIRLGKQRIDDWLRRDQLARCCCVAQHSFH